MDVREAGEVCVFVAKRATSGLRIRAFVELQRIKINAMIVCTEINAR